MIKRDINAVVSILLFFALSFTGTTGLLSHKLDLHQFWPHRYGAYSTLFLALVHVSLNLRQFVTYIRARLQRVKG
ncbi:MAG TPA: hypothetical protein ACFYD1_00010 [Candidatus Hypogeohydataceae bacterium YC38]